MQKSLFGKYLRVTMVIVLASFIVLGSVMMFVFSQYTKSDKRKLLMQNASSMASITSSVDITNNGAPELLKIFVRTFSLNIDADIFVTDLEGNVLFGAYANSTSNIGANFTPQTKISADIVKCASEGSYTGDGRKNGIYDTPYYVVGVPLYSVAETSSSEAGGENSTRVPVGAVFAAMNAASLTEYQFAALQMFLIAAAAAFILAFVVVGLFSYRLVKPLRQMSAAAKSFGDGDFSIRVPVTSNDEIGQLATAFNNMADSLSGSESMNRSFVANVSHELKTPMTTIAGFIDGILDGTIPPERQSHYLHIVSDEVKRLSRLVRTMLNLSRIDSGELQLRPTDFDISRVPSSPPLLTFEQKHRRKGHRHPRASKRPGSPCMVLRRPGPCSTRSSTTSSRTPSSSPTTERRHLRAGVSDSIDRTVGRHREHRPRHSQPEELAPRCSSGSTRPTNPAAGIKTAWASACTLSAPSSSSTAATFPSPPS